MRFTEPPFSAPWADPPATPAGVASRHALNYIYDDLDAVHPGAVELAVRPEAVDDTARPGAAEAPYRRTRRG